MRKKWRPKKVRKHEWYAISRSCGYLYCGRCGLINLNNDKTIRQMERPCQGLEEEDTE